MTDRRISIFGKLPNQADFFSHASNDVARDVERWLLESSQTLLGAGHTFPDSTVHLILARPQWKVVTVVMGVGSRDSVSRAFPLFASTAIDAHLVAGRGWLIPLAAARFFRETETALLNAARHGDSARLVAQLEGVAPIDTVLFQRAEAIFDNAMRTQTARAFEERVFSHRHVRYYGYRTLRSACSGAPGSAPEKAETVLGCPLENDVDLVVWANMAGRLLRWHIPPSMVWMKRGGSRLLLSLGFPPVQIIRYLVDERIESMRYWPLHTEQADALASARIELESTAAWDVEGETLRSLVERVAPKS